MRHEFASGPVASSSGRVSESPTAGSLIATSGLAYAIAACVGGAVTAVSIAAIATAADEDLCPAAGAQIQAARGLRHWRFLSNAKDEESTKVDGLREQCDTGCSHGAPVGRWACHLETLWRCGAELDLAVEAGAAPVVLLRQTPFYHAPSSMRCGARLQSPYGLLTSHPASTTCSSRIGRILNFHFYACAVPPLYDAAGKARILIAIDSGNPHDSLIARVLQFKV